MGSLSRTRVRARAIHADIYSPLYLLRQMIRANLEKSVEMFALKYAKVKDIKLQMLKRIEFQ